MTHVISVPGGLDILAATAVSPLFGRTGLVHLHYLFLVLQLLGVPAFQIYQRHLVVTIYARDGDSDLRGVVLALLVAESAEPQFRALARI